VARDEDSVSRVVVTGGAGKAGRAVVRDLLDHGYDVVSVDLVRDANLTGAHQIVADVTDYAEAVDALNAEGVLAMRIYDPDTPDLHVYPFWAPVLAAIEADGRPAPDCPRTLGLLERSIHIDVSPLCEEQDLDEIAFAFEKVAKQVLV